MQNNFTYSETERCMSVYNSPLEALESLKILPFFEKRHASKILRKLAYARRHTWFEGYGKGNMKTEEMLHDLCSNKNSFTNKTPKMAQTEDGYVIFSDAYHADWEKLNDWKNSVDELANLNRPDIMPFHIYPFQKEYGELDDLELFLVTKSLNMEILCTGYNYFSRGTIIGFMIRMDEGDVYSINNYH